MNDVQSQPHQHVQRRYRAIALGVTLVFAIATLVLTRSPLLARSSAVAAPLSSASGLMTLHLLAQTSIPFDSALINQKPTLIEFYADWCTTCQSTAATLQEVHQAFRSDINVVMMNIDDPQWQSQVRQYQVTGVPQLTLLDPSHSVAETWVGKVPKGLITERILSILSPPLPDPT